MPQVQHIRLRRKDSGVIAPTVREQRIVARTVLTRGEAFGLLVFSAADTHLHLAAACATKQAGEFARRIEIALTRQLAAKGFVPALIDQVRDHWHLHNLCLYILRQNKHHGIEQLDPMRECSNLPDLLGARLLGAHTASSLRRLLPRFSKELYRLADLNSLEPANGPLELLSEATAAAVCCNDLQGHSADVTAAIRAALVVAAGQLPNVELARLLGTSRRRLSRLKAKQPDAALVQAIRLQLSLRGQRLALTQPPSTCSPEANTVPSGTW